MNNLLLWGAVGVGAWWLLRNRRATTDQNVFQANPLPPNYRTDPRVQEVLQRQLARLGLAPNVTGMVAFAQQHGVPFTPSASSDAELRNMIMEIDREYRLVVGA